MSSIQIMLDLIGRDLTPGAFRGALSGFHGLRDSIAQANKNLAQLGLTFSQVAGAALGAYGAYKLFSDGTQLAVDAGAQLQMAGTMAAIAISDGTQHVNELETAIVNLANNSQYKIADVDQAFRMLGERGFNTAQILQGGLGQQSINLGQAMGDTAVNGADVLSQALRLMTNSHLDASTAADQLTRAFYDGMPAASDLSTFLGMAGGSANVLHMSLKDLLVAGDLLTPVMGGASQAGASLNYMLNQMVAPTGPAASAIKQLNLQIFDGTGKFVGFKNVMDQLISKMKDMPDSERMPLIRDLFSTRSGRGAQDLIGMLGQFDTRYSKIATDIGQVGTAQKDATAINETATGAWNRLGTTVNDFFAQPGKIINGWLVPVYDWLNKLFSTLQNSSGWNAFFATFLLGGKILSGVVLVVAGLVAIIALGLGPVLAVAAIIFAGIVATAALVSLVINILNGNISHLTGAFAFLNPVIDVVRGAFNWLTSEIRQNSAALAPLLPFLKQLGIGFLVLIGIVVGVFVAGLLIAIGIVLGVVLVIEKLAQAIEFLVAHVPGWWNSFTGAIQGALNNADNAIRSWWAGVVRFFQGIPGQAVTWGRDLIQSFINGLLGSMGNITSALGRVGQTIFSFLHHSTPDEGPLAGDDQWGGELVQNFAKGMLSGVTHVASASGVVANSVRSGILGGQPQLAAQAITAGRGGGTQVYNISLYPGSKQVAQVVYDSLKGTLQQNGMSRSLR